MPISAVHLPQTTPTLATNRPDLHAPNLELVALLTEGLVAECRTAAADPACETVVEPEAVMAVSADY